MFSISILFWRKASLEQHTMTHVPSAWIGPTDAASASKCMLVLMNNSVWNLKILPDLKSDL